MREASEAYREPLQLLRGVRIVAFTQWLLGPSAAQYLGDMGAEVIKIERPGGSWERRWAGAESFVNGVSVCFLATHRNVQSLALDLGLDDGKLQARRLIQTCDVLLANYRPGVLERFGLDYESVRQLKPDIIYACADGYGGAGSPYAHEPGQDLLIQALSGLISSNGRQGQPSRPVGAPIVDQHAGLLLAAGVLGALVYRSRTGLGQKVEVNMLEAALDLQLEPLSYFLNGGRLEEPSGPLASHYHEAPYGVYEAADGRVVISLSPIKALFAALNEPNALVPFLDANKAYTQRDDIAAAVQACVIDWPADVLLETLKRGGVWCAPVNDYDAVVRDPAFKYLDPLVDVGTVETGTVRSIGHPIHYSSGEPRIKRGPPTVDQDGDRIRTELGRHNA